MDARDRNNCSHIVSIFIIRIYLFSIRRFVCRPSEQIKKNERLYENEMPTKTSKDCGRYLPLYARHIFCECLSVGHCLVQQIGKKYSIVCAVKVPIVGTAEMEQIDHQIRKKIIEMSK